LTADSTVTGPPAKRAAVPQPPTVVAAPVPVSPSEIPRQESPQPLQYGPGPSLRPQTEGSWVQGGRPSNVSPSQGGSGNIELDLKLSVCDAKLFTFSFYPL
jgi:outer membrane receptor protein involved in Fe transport